MLVKVSLSYAEVSSINPTELQTLWDTVTKMAISSSILIKSYVCEQGKYNLQP